MVDSNAGAVGYTRLAASAWVGCRETFGWGEGHSFFGAIELLGRNGEINGRYLLVGVKDLREFNREGLK